VGIYSKTKTYLLEEPKYSSLTFKKFKMYYFNINHY